MNYLVIGGGISGLDAARLLKQRKNNVILVDAKPLKEESLGFCQNNQISFFLQEEFGFNKMPIDKVILSPGVPLSLSIVKSAKALNIPIIAEIELALENFTGPIIAITGTNGKSTTVSMIHHIFNALEIESSLCGNIGITPSSLAIEDKLKGILVLELSSYQLEHISSLPNDFACICSFSSDHLARHKTLDRYFLAKWKIFSWLKSNGQSMMTPSVLTYANSLRLNIPSNMTIIKEENWKKLKINEATTNLQGEHNLANAYVAVNACHALTATPISSCISALKNFRGLPHRLEVIAKHKTRCFINDSKATNIESTLVALNSQHKPVCLFLGGESKGNEFCDLLPYKHKIEKIIAFGSAKEQIKNELSAYFQMQLYDTLAKACADLKNIVKSSKGDLLLSPGCASFDEFKNFEERGDFFSAQVHNQISNFIP